MRPLVALACCAPLLAVAACKSPSGLGVSAAQAVPVEAPVIDLAAVEPRLRGVFEELRAALDAGDDARAREIVATIEGAGPNSSDLHLARTARAAIDARVDPRLAPSLAALSAALAADDDVSAEAILERARSLGVGGPAATLFEGYERILAGRRASAGLELWVEARLAAQGDDAAPDRVQIAFVARRRVAGACELLPGPATLRTRARSIDARGNVSSSFDTRAFDELRVLEVDELGTKVVLAELPVALPRGAVALEIACDVDLLSGAIVVDGRRLPARRLVVRPGTAVLFDAALARVPRSSAADVIDAAFDVSHARNPIELALRLDPKERSSVLDALADRHDEISEPGLARLAPALVWLAPDVRCGRDAVAWRAFLRQRALAHRGARPKLDLPGS